MYKLLAVDIDGTLVRRDGRIAKQDKQAIAEVAKTEDENRAGHGSVPPSSSHSNV